MRYLMETEWDTYCTQPANYVDWCIGCARKGDLCFDIIPRVYDDGKVTLTYDLYVGGVDTGYSYSDGYPYDYADGSDFADDCSHLSFTEFKEMAEKEFMSFIDSASYSEANLREKANGPLRVW